MSSARLLCCALLAATAVSLTGCTLYPQKNHPTLRTTTSAEQTQRIFWKDVESGKWVEAEALLAPNAVWRNGSTVIARGAVVPWLRSLGIKQALVSGVTIKSNVNDMTLVYSLQIAAARPVLPLAAGTVAPGATQPQNLQVVAVWQQPQLTAEEAKEKEYHGYLLTVEDLAPAGIPNER
ncbi:MAG: hypothetical protein ACR2JE_15645 [Acidobacteriaceae bacterium]